MRNSRTNSQDMAHIRLFAGLAFAVAAMAVTASPAAALTPSEAFGFFGDPIGDAYSANFLNQIFGPLFPAANNTATQTVFSEIIGYFNICVLVIGGILFFYNITVGVLQSAHEGQVLGQRWSSLWAPLRTLFAVGLLAPMPGLHGYNMAQSGVAYAVKGATMMGSFFWSQSAFLVISGKIPITTAASQMDPDFMKTVFMNQVCVQIMNSQLNNANSSANPLSVQKSVQPVKVLTADGSKPLAPYSLKPTGQLETYTYLHDPSDAGKRVERNICGSVTTPELPEYIRKTTPDDSGILSNLGLPADNSASTLVAFTGAHQLAMSQLSSGFEKIVSDNYSAAANTGGQVPDITDSLGQTILATNDILSKGIQATTSIAAGADMNGQASRDALLKRIKGSCSNTTEGGEQSTQCYGEGWIGAGSWYMMLARMNSELASLANAAPTATGANFMSPKSIYRRTGGETNFFWGVGEDDLKSAGMLTANEAEIIKSRYEEAFDNATAGMAALGFQMSGAQLGELNENTDANSFLSNIPGFSGYMTRLVDAVVQTASPSSWGEDPMIGLTKIGHALIHVASILTPVALLAGSGVMGFTLPSGIATVLIGPISILMGAGATLSYVLPMTPAILWIMAVTGYFLLVMEAVVAVNLWALAHLRMDGDGISGEAGRQGWLMMLSLIFTPTLMVFGLLGGMTIFRVTSALFDLTVSQAMAGVLGGGVFIVFGAMIIYSIMIATCYMMIVERSFTLVSDFPDKIMRWMGSHVNVGADHNAARATIAAGAVAAGGGSRHVMSSAVPAAKTAGDMLKARRARTANGDSGGDSDSKPSTGG